MVSDPVVEAIDLHKEFKRDAFQIIALQDVHLTVQRGDFVAFMGPSGSGKSSLLYLIAAIDRPTRGRVKVLGQDLHQLKEKAIADWRNENVGFVFQTFNLIPVLTARENVELPLLLTRLNRQERAEHAATALGLVGLSDRMDHYPRQLSGGQEQRVAITDPSIILADEPTGDLDAQSAREILTILSRLNRDHGKTVLMVTHDPLAARHAGKIRYLEKGKLLPEGAHQPE